MYINPQFRRNFITSAIKIPSLTKTRWFITIYLEAGLCLVARQIYATRRLPFPIPKHIINRHILFRFSSTPNSSPGLLVSQQRSLGLRYNPKISEFRQAAFCAYDFWFQDSQKPRRGFRNEDGSRPARVGRYMACPNAQTCASHATAVLRSFTA